MLTLLHRHLANGVEFVGRTERHLPLGLVAGDVEVTVHPIDSKPVIERQDGSVRGQVLSGQVGQLFGTEQ